MMKDYYSILHVLPSAEIDVIKAAYKALARKYHPDTFDGVKAYASKRMQEINDAFGVIGDPEKRKKYDAERNAANQEDEFTSNDNDVDTRLEEDWLVACKYCPEATDSFNHLNKLSRSLAFTFKSYLLDSKQFSECMIIRDKFRAEFLKNYFGSNPAIQEIGEKLVLAGELKAAKSVNRTVKVMGASLDPDKLIEMLWDDFPQLKPKTDAKRSLSRERELFSIIKEDPYNWAYYDELLNVLKVPFKVSFLGNYIITHRGRSESIPANLMQEWVINNLGNLPQFRNI